MSDLKLYMLLLGAVPEGRHTEQHDVFFTVGASLKELVPAITAFWPEGKKVHIDAWREITEVDGHAITVVPKEAARSDASSDKLFFINLGGYKKDEFEEFHYKMVVVAPDKGKAIQQSTKTAFYKHTGFPGAESHVDDKYGIDVDDIYAIEDILPQKEKEKYAICISPAGTEKTDTIHLGYFKLDKL